MLIGVPFACLIRPLSSRQPPKLRWRAPLLFNFSSFSLPNAIVSLFSLSLASLLSMTVEQPLCSIKQGIRHVFEHELVWFPFWWQKQNYGAKRVTIGKLTSEKSGIVRLPDFDQNNQDLRCSGVDSNCIEAKKYKQALTAAPAATQQEERRPRKPLDEKNRLTP